MSTPACIRTRFVVDTRDSFDVFELGPTKFGVKFRAAGGSDIDLLIEDVIVLLDALEMAKNAAVALAMKEPR